VSVPLRKEGAVASELDKRAEEYRTKAAHSREKAEAMLSEEARRTMFEAAEMWEAMAVSLERQRRRK
jgi:hypothetical protein